MIPFLASPRRMLIAGRWVDALSGERIDSIDPATGRQTGEIDSHTFCFALEFERGIDFEGFRQTRARLFLPADRLIPQCVLVLSGGDLDRRRRGGRDHADRG
jgi:hypothetical protein